MWGAMDIELLPTIVVSVVLIGVWGCYRLIVRSRTYSDSHKGAGNVNVVQPIVSHTSDGHLRRRRHIQDTLADSACQVRTQNNADCHNGMGSWLSTAEDGPTDDDCGSGQSDVKTDESQSITDQRQIPRIVVGDQSKNILSDEWGGQLSDDDDDDEYAQARSVTKCQQVGDTSKPSPVSEVRRLVQALSKAREASERAQDWADFLERELLAHINARISVEEKHKRALHKLSATRLVNKRVKQRCERLQIELRELHIGIEQCVGENNNVEPDMKTIGIRRPGVDKTAAARTGGEDSEESEIGASEEVIRLLEEPPPTEEEAFIEELFAKEVSAADTDEHELFNDIDEAKSFWEEQHKHTALKRPETRRAYSAGSVATVDRDAQDGGGDVDRAECGESREGSEHGSDPECSVQSKKEMWEERLRMGVRNHPVDSNCAVGGGGDATDVQLSAEELGNVQRTKTLWAEKASTHSSPGNSPRLPHRSTKSDVSPGSIQLAKQLWEERTFPGTVPVHSPARRLSAGEANLSGENSDSEAPAQRLITREGLMTSERECENTSDNVLAESLPSVSQTKMLFEQ